MRINFDLDDLEAFLAVKETGSFHLAAERLALSQSAVTRRVQKLETALDAVLFERTTRKVKPTLAAKRLQARAEAILDDARETARAIRDDSVAYSHQRNLVVTIAIIPTLVTQLIPTALERMQKAGQTVRLRLLDMASNEVSDAVAEGEADFGVSSMPAQDPSLSFERLFEDEMGVVMPADHPLAQLETLTWDHMRTVSLILPARKTGNRVLIDDALARANDAIAWMIETERSTTALALVGCGAGCAILPKSVLHAQGKPNLMWRRLRNPTIVRPIGLLSRTGQSDPRAVDAFKKALRATQTP